MTTHYWLSAILTSAMPVISHAESMDHVVEHCFACHRQAEQQHGLMPINGRNRQALTTLLLDFKYDRRTATLMPRILKAFTDDELMAMAAALEQR